MKPIRKDELEFWNNFTNDEFYEKQRSVDTEITQEAQTLADKRKDNFVKECGLHKELEALKKEHKAYEDFVDNKAIMENKLKHAWEKASEQFKAKVQRLSKARNWEDMYLGDTSTVNPNTAESKLNDACYQEAKNHVKKNHKVYNSLDKVRKRCRMIIHTGAHINSVVSSLKKEMSKAEIVLEVPQTLLELPSK
jgi:hypothetical protein